jgi:hypothetical protein
MGDVIFPPHNKGVLPEFYSTQNASLLQIVTA